MDKLIFKISFFIGGALYIYLVTFCAFKVVHLPGLILHICQRNKQKYLIKCVIIREGDSIHTGRYKVWVRNRFQPG